MTAVRPLHRAAADGGRARLGALPVRLHRSWTGQHAGHRGVVGAPVRRPAAGR